MKTIQRLFIPATFIVQIVLRCTAYSQAPPLSQQDSVALATAFNDTTALRQLTIQRHGDRVAAKAHNRIGDIKYEHGREQSAEGDYQQVYDQYLNLPERQEAALGLGKAEYKQGNYEQAKAHFRACLNSNPTPRNADWARYNLLRAMRRTNDSTMVSAVQAYLASPHPATQAKDANIKYDLVRHLDERGNYAQAITEARSFIMAYPSSEYVSDLESRVIGYCALRGDNQGAIAQCNTILQKYPANTNNAARAQHSLAAIYSNMNDLDRARIEYGKVATLHPSMTRWKNAAEYGLAQLDMTEGYAQQDSLLLAQTLTKLLAFVTSHPMDRHVPRVLQDIAHLCMDAERYQEALIAYNGIINFSQALIDSGETAKRSNDLKTHREMVLRAHMAKVMLLRVQMQDPASALAECEFLLSEHPGMVEVLLDKAVCLIALDRTTEARPILQGLVQGETNVKEAAVQILSTLG